MSDARTSEIKGKWQGAHGDAPLTKPELIELVRLLARNAAAQDYKQHTDEQEKDGTR